MDVQVRYNDFWYISLQSSAKQREMTKFCVVHKTRTTKVNFLIVISNVFTLPQIQCRDSLTNKVKACLHRPFLSRQHDAIFVASKLHQVSNMFETPTISRRQIAVKIASGLHVRF